MNRSVLVIDDDQGMLDLLRAELEPRGFEVATCPTAEAALGVLAAGNFGVVLSDLTMGGMSGVDLCREVVLIRENIPVVVMTAFASIEWAIASIRAGAYDFVTKPFAGDELALTLERALRHGELRDEVKRLRTSVSELRPFDEILGESDVMKKMFELVSRVAESDATVLISGESGTGKELVARAIHTRSARASGPFVAINCAAMPESLLESELFGHVKGAFTDAHTQRTGLFARATGGTLLLDEIAEMPAGMQAKLLRALQERTVRPVGGDAEIPFDVRVVAATNRDLEVEVEEKRFREDLFYRVNVVHVPVPPLRSRDSDIVLLAVSFLERAQAKGTRRVTGIDTAAAERLASYPWPGNVRELQNCMQRAAALAEGERVSLADLPERIREHKPTRAGLPLLDVASILTMEEVELRYIRQVLDGLGGNKASAARVLGLDRRTLYRKLERWSKSAQGSPSP